MVDHLRVLTSESARFLEAVSGAEPGAAVPTCRGWSTEDLAWHLTEVQAFWADVVESGTDDPRRDVETPDRPTSFARVLSRFEQATQRLAAVLGDADPEATCWSWHDGGGTVAWVRRRQAHEALIHRVDAEHCAGIPVHEPEPDVAHDGVDEVLRVMIAGTPAWGSFTPDGDRVVIVTRDVPGDWTLALGRFTGTSPDDDRIYDLDASELTDDDWSNDPRYDTAVVTGRAWDLDRWLWGRVTTTAFEIRGAGRLVERLRLLAADATR